MNSNTYYILQNRLYMSTESFETFDFIERRKSQMPKAYKIKQISDLICMLCQKTIDIWKTGSLTSNQIIKLKRAHRKECK